jgi:hypothetical protein
MGSSIIMDHLNGSTSHDAKAAERKTLRKRNKWSHWLGNTCQKTGAHAMEEIIENSEIIELNNGARTERKKMKKIAAHYWESTGGTRTPNSNLWTWYGLMERKTESRW